MRTITAIFNDAWADNWGFVPLSVVETEYLAKSLKPLIDPRLVSMVELRGEPVGFLVCLPNLNEAIRDLGGSLLPFGWATLLWRLKIAGARTVRVPLMGIRRAAQQGMIGKLLPFLLTDKVRKDAAGMGLTHVELS